MVVGRSSAAAPAANKRIRVEAGHRNLEDRDVGARVHGQKRNVGDVVESAPGIVRNGDVSLPQQLPNAGRELRGAGGGILGRGPTSLGATRPVPLVYDFYGFPERRPRT